MCWILRICFPLGFGDPVSLAEDIDHFPVGYRLLPSRYFLHNYFNGEAHVFVLFIDGIAAIEEMVL